MESTKDKEFIFSLDIGTRTVIGIVGYYEDDMFQIVQSISMEHQERAMLDGQIHDIDKVAHIISEVKCELEKEIGTLFKEVSIAAAGRVLNTQISYVSHTFEVPEKIEKKHIQNLHFEGVELAKKMVIQEMGDEDRAYYCVGHSVMHDYLDDYIITNLEGHKGKKISTKILATFLPKEVINSLYSATEQAGLTVKQLTLEPIAAMNAVIPDNLRLLNLALVDVGAGTSDIAITKEGSVLAYGMIPIAGDEITEAIVHHYLVDFNTAEQIKQKLSEEIIAFNDIIGLSYEVSSKEILEFLNPTIKQLAEEISCKILELNGDKTVNAVFCVGGGSQIPGLIEEIATKLGLPSQRVALRSAEHIPGIQYEVLASYGPEIITPIGIGITTAKYFYNEFTKVMFNGEPVTLLNTKALTVLDVLVDQGISHQSIFPSRGKSLMFKLNGERIRLKGELGKGCKLFKNNQLVSLDTPIHTGDQIVFEPAQPGVDASSTIKAYCQSFKKIIFEGDAVHIPLIVCNGDYQSTDYKISQGDAIKIIDLKTAKDLLEYLGYDNKTQILANGKSISLDDLLKDGDEIQISSDFMQNQETKSQDEEVISKDLTLLVNNQMVTLPYQEKEYMYVQVFDYIDFDLSRPQGTIQLRLNGERAAVTDLLKSGDKLEIFWEK